MMRAWAAIAAAAVLVALPTTVDRAAADALPLDTTTPVAAADAGLAADSNLGVLLWLSVALIAVVVSCVVLRRSRSQLAAGPDTAVGGTLTELRSATATSGR